MQILPFKELLPFIRHYLFLESVDAGIKRLRLFSDGTTGLVFSQQNKLALNQNNNVLERLPNSFLYGQITEFKDIFLSNETMLVIVVFQPAGINKLLGLPANDLRDSIVSAEDIFGKKGLMMEKKMAEKCTIQEKLFFLNSFFSSLLSRKDYRNGSLVPASLDFIFKNRGLTTLPQLVKFTGYTERHIERKFLESIGIAPKRFINIVKLHSFLKHLNNNTGDANLTQIAYEAGYTDQSHLIKEFKKHTGMTPKLYRDKAAKLAVNLVAFLPSVVKSDLYNLPKYY